MKLIILYGDLSFFRKNINQVRVVKIHFFLCVCGGGVS